MPPFLFQLSLSPSLIGIARPLSLPPSLTTPFSALGLSGGGLGSSACRCDLDFKAEMVPGADSQRALFLARPGRAGPPLGPSVWLHLGVQVSVPMTACFL